MEEMRVQIEAREPTDGEIRAFLVHPAYRHGTGGRTAGIDVDTDYYSITGKELPFC